MNVVTRWLERAGFLPGPDDYRPEGCTHVMAWLPPYFIKGTRHGWWELMTAAEYYEGPGWQPDDELCAPLPRGGSFDAIADWIASHVDFPFVLAEEPRRIRGAHWWSRWHSEPVFYVIPDPDGECARQPVSEVTP